MTLETDNYAYPGARYTQDGMPVGHGQGMTLRDYFAGQVLASATISATEGNMQWMTQHGAEYAYKIADAMIAQRQAQ